MAYLDPVAGTARENQNLGGRRAVEAKTADYAVVAADANKVLTNRGAAGTVIFTLPAAATALAGMEVTIMAVVAAQTVTVAGTAGQLVTFNDPAANSVSFQTAVEIIGGALRCVCDGTSWLLMALVYDTQTVTIVT